MKIELSTIKNLIKDLEALPEHYKTRPVRAYTNGDVHKALKKFLILENVEFCYEDSEEYSIRSYIKRELLKFDEDDIEEGIVLDV